MQAFYWSLEEYEADLTYEATMRELARHTWTIATRNGPTVVQTRGTMIEVQTGTQPPYTVDRWSAAARLRAWRRAGLRMTRGAS